jgi:enoyl-CoA hydratase/carnithine racemase
MSDELVLIEKRDGIATMTLNRPPRLVTRVVPKERLQAEARAVAERITKASPQAVLATRRAVNLNVRHRWDEMVRYEQEVCLQVFAHPDAAEGPRAFTEKREPRFSVL